MDWQRLRKRNSMVLISWVLVAINLVFAGMIASERGTVFRVSPSVALHPEQIKLVSPSELSRLSLRMPAALPAESPPMSSIHPSEESALVQDALACYEWGSFSASNRKKALLLTKQLKLKALISQQTAANQNTRYWIYRPPAPNLAEAQAKADEFKRLGVDEVFIVQAPSDQYAISFGVFRDEQLANKLMDALTAKGINQVVKARRLGGEGQTMLQLNFVAPQQYRALKQSQALFPDAVLKAVACPAMDA